MKTITATEFARNLSEVINQACYAGETTSIMKNGKEVARLVPPPRNARTGAEIAAILKTEKRHRLTRKEVDELEASMKSFREGWEGFGEKWES